MKINLWMLVALSLSATACSSLKVQKDEVEKTKRVAIVGFNLLQDNPKTPLLSFGSTDNSGMGGMNGALCEESPHAKKIAEKMRAQLEKDMSWKIVPFDVQQKDPNIAAILGKQKENGRILHIIPQNTTCYIGENIPESYFFDLKSLEERQAIMKSLKVDALVVAVVRVELLDYSMLSVVGGSDNKARSALTFYVYNGTQKDPIWRDVGAQGKTSEKGTVQWLGMTNKDKANEKIVGSVDSALQDLMNRYKGEKQ